MKVMFLFPEKTHIALKSCCLDNQITFSAEKAEGGETDRNSEGEGTSSRVKEESPILCRSERATKGISPQRYVPGTNTVTLCSTVTVPKSFQDVMQLPVDQQLLWQKGYA